MTEVDRVKPVCLAGPPEEIDTDMSAPIPINANRRKDLSPGFAGAIVLMEGEEKTEFHLLLNSLYDAFFPVGPDEQILFEKMVLSQWQSLQAGRLQKLALLPRDLTLLIRGQQAADQAYDKAQTALLSAQEQRQKSRIGFVPQSPITQSPD
jgi:hypothetical protein